MAGMLALVILAGLAVRSAALRNHGSNASKPEDRLEDDARGDLFRRSVNETTWEGWEPPADFASTFSSWPDVKVPDDIQVWCKGFIPDNATQETIKGYATIPIALPGGIPVPGLVGMCAHIDGRSWSAAHPSNPRPDDSRYWAWMEVAGGEGQGVKADGKCGVSNNICCNPKGCWGGSKYGDVTCSMTCPDEEMQIRRQACWTEEGIENRSSWPAKGENCAELGAIVAAKAYIHGRGGNPCGKTLGVSPPPASWDVGVAIFPTKRKVTLTGFVDEAPSYECYARAKDFGVWGPTVTLAQVPMDMTKNIAIALAGFSNRPINPRGTYFDLPSPSMPAQHGGLGAGIYGKGFGLNPKKWQKIRKKDEIPGPFSSESIDAKVEALVVRQASLRAGADKNYACPAHCYPFLVVLTLALRL